MADKVTSGERMGAAGRAAPRHGGGSAEAARAAALRITVEAVLPLIDAARGRRGHGRVLLALAGPPAAGKSTLSAALVERLGADAAVLPMDGFHLDNALLEARGLRPRKGAPATFDVAGLASTLARVRADRGPVIVPSFDRRLDLARAGAAEISPAHRTVIVEGNYLLLDEPPWTAIARTYDASVFLQVPESVVEARILARWRRHGLDERAARTRALENDVPNAALVMRGSAAADLVLDEAGRRVAR